MPVRKKGNRWEVRVSVRGKRVERRLPAGATRQDALEYEATSRRNMVDDALGRRAPTISEILNKWEPDAKRLKSWDRDLKYRVAALRRKYGDWKTDELPAIAADLKKRILGAGKSPAAANRYLAILRRAVVCSGGSVRIALVSGERTRTNVLTAGSLRLLLSASDARLKPMIEFAVLTGMRKAEQLALTAALIRDGCAVLPDTKAGRPRVIPLPPRALEIARRHLPWVLRRDNVRRLFDAARAAAGLPDVRWHDLRRTYGSMLVSAGAPLHAVRDLLGHADISTTSVYLATVRPDLEKAVALLPMGKARGRKKAKAR